MRLIAVERPVSSSTEIRTPLNLGFSVAASNRDGMPVRKRDITPSRSIPMMESCGPVMPTSVM